MEEFLLYAYNKILFVRELLINSLYLYRTSLLKTFIYLEASIHRGFPYSMPFFKETLY
jgi:hypothetical protein